MAEDYSDAIKFALQKLQYENIRDYQQRVIVSYLSGKDVFFCAPTGSGKSLVFEIAPFLFQHLKNIQKCTVIIVSPLISLMKSQALGLQRRDIKAVYLKDVFETTAIDESFMNLSLDDIQNGDINILFASPESLLDNQRQLILELSRKKVIQALFVDEAHCIKKFGKPDLKKKKEAYRPCYGRLTELRSLVGGNVPVVALTATASEETKLMIQKDLCMDNCDEIILSPNKKNITYWVLHKDSDDLCTNFQWLIRLLKDRKNETPRTVIFFRQIKHIAEVYELLETSLGKDAYINYKEEGPNDDRNRLFDMFHIKTDEDVKNSICASYYDPDGNIRIVLCSTSFSMGLDVKGVDTVIHYGPANDIDDYIQESGRAGRDITNQSNAILFKYKRCLGSQNVSAPMKEYVKSTKCRRKFLMNKLGFSVDAKGPNHMCCDVCKDLCKCACECQNECFCDKLCKEQLPDILEVILRYKDEDDATTSDDSSDSDIELIRRKPNIVYSSDDEL